MKKVRLALGNKPSKKEKCGGGWGVRNQRGSRTWELVVSKTKKRKYWDGDVWGGSVPGQNGPGAPLNSRKVMGPFPRVGKG